MPEKKNGSKFVKLYLDDFRALQQTDKFPSSISVLVALTASAHYKTGYVPKMTITQLSEKSNLSRSAAYNGLNVLIDQGIFEPNPDSKFITGTINLPDSQPEPEESNGTTGNFDSFAR